MTALIRYEAACAALAECERIDDVLAIRDDAERLRLYARQAKDRTLLQKAAVIGMRAERQLGILIARAKERGHFRQGPRAKSSDTELLARGTLAEAGVDKKLSMRAQRHASISERAFEVMVERTRERIASGRATVIDNELATQEKQQRRENRERVLGEMQQSLPTKKYGVILADPEWKFEPYSRKTGMDRAADNHYPTSELGDIIDRDVPSIAAKDCALFLWATVPMIGQALSVMDAWGFDYKSHMIWHKDRIGTGYWFRNAHELLLVGTKGNIPAPAPGTQWASVIAAPVGAHSAKPEIFLRMIEEYFPTLPKIELNCRGPARPGWDAWGNESESLPPHDPDTGEILHNHTMRIATQPP